MAALVENDGEPLVMGWQEVYNWRILGGHSS